MTTANKSKTDYDDTNNQDELDDSHRKPWDWPGWNDTSNRQFALELQHPWAQEVLDGRKTIETRSYSLPLALRKRWIALLESPKGQPGVSGLGDLLDLTKNGDGVVGAPSPRIVGWCLFDSNVVEYKTRKQFERDEGKHLVTRSSGYGWREGSTEVIYGWVVRKCRALDHHVSYPSQSIKYISATRRLRSLFELHSQSSVPTMIASKNCAESLATSTQGKKTKKKRRKLGQRKPAPGI